MPAPSNASGFVYAVQANWMVKIGWAMDVKRRLPELQCGSPMKLQVIFTMPGTGDAERELHFRFHKWRKHGEWFDAAIDLMSYLEALRDLNGPRAILAKSAQCIGPDGFHGTIHYRLPPWERCRKVPCLCWPKS